MVLPSLMVTAILAVGVQQGVEPDLSSQSADKSAQTAATTVDKADLPVSLDHIREGLKRAPEPSLLRVAELPADFRVHILEQQRINDIMSKLDFKSPPAPAGGLYAYEQQRRLFNPTDRPLMQPYAAFSAGEFFTIAAENLLGKYLGPRIANAISSAGRQRSDRAAREEVDRAIADYCAGRPDRQNIYLCTSAADER
jgi:hypothetical protein